VNVRISDRAFNFAQLKGIKFSQFLDSVLLHLEKEEEGKL